MLRSVQHDHQSNTKPEIIAMNEHHSSRATKITTGLVGLFLFGWAAFMIVVAHHNGPIVLVPFVLAVLISCGAIWWAHSG